MVLELPTRWLAAAVVLAALPRSAGATAMGALKLDNYTFDKVASLPGITLLTKVDKSYAYGEKEDAFKELCKLAHPVKGFLIGEVPVQEYGDKENEDLQNRFKVSTDEFPAYLLFKGSEAAPTKFVGIPDPRSSKPKDWDDDEDGEWEAPYLEQPTAENLALWLRKYGVKMPAIGTIVELDEIAEKFMKEGMQDALVAEAKKVAQEQYPDDKKAPLYIKTMEKVKAKGAGYIQTELARVQKIMSGQITPEKAAELGDKVKILQVFAIS